MLNWLRYFPLALSFRENVRDYVVPHGPLFPQLREQQWYMGGSRFHFAAPWANAVYGFAPFYRHSSSYSSGKHNVLNYELRSVNSDVMPNGRWQASLIYLRQWHFVGPWFSGDCGGLHMGAVLYGQPHLNDFKGTSFFHPRVFESAIADFLSSYFGHKKYGRKPYHRGPLNWKIISLSESIQAASFDIFSETGEIEKYIVFPVAHNRLIGISFSGIAEDQRQYDQTPIIDLMQSIINSFRLEVGPDMQAQWEEVKAYCPDMSLTTEFGELKWPINPKDVGKPIDTSSATASNEILGSPVEKLY